MAWRNCVASIKLGHEIAQRWPKRDFLSDGTIGDAAHASRNSDHNPWVVVNGVGVVRARDIDEDLDGNRANGSRDAAVLFDHLHGLAKRGDNRLNGGGYLIYEGRIYSERENWASRPYSGPNAHKIHIHVSFSRNAAGFDSDKPWGLLTPQAAPRQLVKQGVRGANVAFIADMGNILALAGMTLDGKGKPSRTQIPTPKDAGSRANFLFDKRVHDQVMGAQRFGRAMWALAGKKGPEPKIDGIVGDQTLGIYAFWVPIALSKK